MNFENSILAEQKNIDVDKKEKAEVERMAQEIACATPQVSWETYIEGRSYFLRVSLPYGCFISGTLRYESEEKALLYIEMFQVNENLQGRGIGKRLMQSFVVEGREYGARNLLGHVTSESALKTRAKVFVAENLEFYNHITKEKIPITYDQALAQQWFDYDVKVNLEEIDTSGWEAPKRKDN